MKLSERMMLGSTTMSFNPDYYFNIYEDCGCLLGQAIGRESLASLSQAEQVYEIYRQYPWLKNRFFVPPVIANYKGNNWYVRHAFNETPGKVSAQRIISALAFLVHAKEITYEQAVDWVVANEPQETQEEKQEIVEQFCEQLINQ